MCRFIQSETSNGQAMLRLTTLGLRRAGCPPLPHPWQCNFISSVSPTEPTAMSRRRPRPTSKKPTPPTGSILPPGVVGRAFRASPLPQGRWALYRCPHLRKWHCGRQAKRYLEDRATAARALVGACSARHPRHRADNHLASGARQPSRLPRQSAAAKGSDPA